MTGKEVERHDAKYSAEVVEIFRGILTSEKATVEGLVFDPFGGRGDFIGPEHMGRDDFYGMEIQPQWAVASKRIRQGNALVLGDYPKGIGCIATSPCYGNRFADQYLGTPCKACDGTGLEPTGVEHLGAIEMGGCQECEGTGRDAEGRFSYAISLGEPVHEDSAASMHFTNGAKGHEYRHFHRQWLNLIARDILEPGPRRLILNMKDHYRKTTVNGVAAQRRQYACDWWLHAAHDAGFRLVGALPALTSGQGYGANMQTGKVDHEMVFIFDLTGGK